MTRPAWLTLGRATVDAELQTIAASYSVVVLAKFHAGWDIALHHEAVRRVKERNPHINLDEAERRRLERLCVGSFLLGWQPGSTFFNMGSGYGTEQLSQQPPDIDLALGAPVEAMPLRHDGDALSRRFEDGAVYVNLGSQPVKIDLPMPMVQTDGVRPGATVDGTVTVPAQDAVLFLYAPTHPASRSEPLGA